MELPLGMGVPASILSTQSPGSPQPSQRNLLTGSTQMEQSILAGRLKDKSSSPSIQHMESVQSTAGHVNRSVTSECSRDGIGGVEVWGWTGDVENWNKNQQILLKSFWRPSTRKTYDVAWKKWVDWCENHQIAYKNPKGAELARFLSDLYLVHGLSYNTILLYKSVVSTLCSTDASSVLSSHSLVKHILKAIALKKPTQGKPPIWDVEDLLIYLNNYTIDEDNIFHVSRHTALLLLLCSGRRIHDLTLLSTDLEYCIKTTNSIIFWPMFGSKTDSQDYRQSGWKFSMNNQSQKLDPIFWINKLINIANGRREEAGCYNLFMSFRGDPKPASRAVIAGWIKSLLVEANITASPGSVRSAVASSNWLNNCPLDEILARGNWRSGNTFRRFYRREVKSTPTNKITVSNLFTPIQ